MELWVLVLYLYLLQVLNGYQLLHGELLLLGNDGRMQQLVLIKEVFCHLLEAWLLSSGVLFW